MSAAVPLHAFVSGGAGLGLGHVVRAIEIAREALGRGIPVEMRIAGDGAARILAREALPAARIEAWCGPEDAARPGAHLLFDTREPIAAELARGRAAGAFTVVLDRTDHADDADLTILPNLHGEPARHARVRAGAELCPIAPELRALAAREEESERHLVLVTLGGADPHDFTTALCEPLARALAAWRPAGAEVHVVLGRCFGPRPALLERAAALGWRTHFDLGRRELGLLMARSLFAITGFGTTAYELAFLGTPALWLVHHASDVAPARRLERAGFGAFAGGPDFDAARFERRLAETALALAWRVRASARGRRALGDGGGAARILDAIEEAAAPAALREASA